jgi:putative oxidoreductase
MKLSQTQSDTLYAFARIGLGALFFMYGLKNLFGFWMPNPVILYSLGWFAGVGQCLIGLGLITGVLTRLAAFFGVIEMLVAFLTHTSTGDWNPLTNKGGAALTFVLAFTFLLAYGAKKWSLEHKVFGKEWV